MIKLDNLDKLILNGLCLDKRINELYLILGIPKSTLTDRLGLLKTQFGVRTNTGLVYKYTLHEEK